MKKVKIIYVVFLFALAFIWHFAYSIFPNPVFAWFFPVNESIWEHMKIIYGTIIFGAFFERYLLKKNNVSYHNFNIEIFVKSFTGIVFYLIIYLPLHRIFGENMFIAIVTLLLTYIFVEWLGTKILKLEDYNITILPIILIILGFILFIILTYYPPRNFMFYDTNKAIYGIPSKK